MYFQKLNISIWGILNYSNVLSLDAPLVVLFWQEIIASALKVDLSVSHRIVLTLSVWLSYSADRFLECYGHISGHLLDTRHLFFYKNKLIFLTFWFGILTLDIYQAIIFFSADHLFISVNVLFLVFLNQYLAICKSKKINNYCSKEFRTALILSIGCVLYPFLNSDCRTLGYFSIPISLFVIFFWNCKLIELWESNLVSNNSKQFRSTFERVLTILHIITIFLGIYFLFCMPDFVFFSISFLSTVFALKAFHKSNLTFDKRRILMDQTFWIIPFILFLFSLCL